MENLRNLRSLRENFVEGFHVDYADVLRAVNGRIKNDKGDVVKCSLTTCPDFNK